MVTQSRAIGTSSIDEGKKIYPIGSSTTGEKALTKLHLENCKDKLPIEESMLIIPRCETKTICRHSDFLTITRKRIYKSQNDP